MRGRLLQAGIAIVLLWPSVSPGGQYVTEDTDIVDLGYWQVTVGLQGARGRSEWSGAAELEVEYGIEEDLALHAAVPWEFARADGGPSFSGIGDAEFGVKYRLFGGENDSRLPSVAFFPIVAVPTGSAAHDLGDGAASLLLPLWVQYEAKSWEVWGGGGYRLNLDGNARDGWLAGLGASVEASPDLVLGAEIFHEAARSEDGNGISGITVGGTYRLTPRHALLFSVGHDFGDPDEARRLSAYVGVSLVF